jgi:DNA-binding response OmpR family regulator
MVGDSSAAANRSIAEAFAAQGFAVAASCHDGLSLAQAAVAHPPEVVALDLVLPKLAGLQVIEAVRRRGVEPIYVVVSAVSAKPRVMAAKEAGVAYYVLKPFDADRLTEVASRLAQQLSAQTA